MRAKRVVGEREERAKTTVQVLSAKSSGFLNAEAAVQDGVRRRQRSVENAGFAGVGNRFDRCLRSQPIQRCEQGRWQHRRVSAIRALLVAVAMRRAETGGRRIEHACHLVAVNWHAVRSCDGGGVNARSEQARARISRYRYLGEQNCDDQQST